MKGLLLPIVTNLLILLLLDSEAFVPWRQYCKGRGDQIIRTSSTTVGALAMSAFSNEQLAEKVQNALNSHKSGNIDAAVVAYEEVIPLIGGKVKTSLCGNLAAIYMMQGQDEKALKPLQIAVDEEPNNASAQYNLAVLLATKLGEYAKAIKHCGKAMKLDGDSNYRSYHLMGNIMQNLGRDEDANKYFIQAEEIALQLRDEQASSGAADSHVLQRLQVFSARRGDVHEAVVDDVGYRLECISEAPLIFIVHDLLSAEECSHIRERAGSKLERSFVMGGDASYENHQRQHAPATTSGSESEAAVEVDGAADTATVDPSLY